MKISIIGCGYVGAVTGAGFSELGHEIIFVDVDQKKLRPSILDLYPFLNMAYKGDYWNRIRNSDLI